MSTALRRLPAPLPAWASLRRQIVDAPWRATLAAFALLALLAAFQFVVQQAVRNGELRRRASAMLADASWRCRTLHDHPSRDQCLAALGGLPVDGAALQTFEVANEAPATQAVAIRP